jgi:hypothetical protein
MILLLLVCRYQERENANFREKSFFKLCFNQERERAEVITKSYQYPLAGTQNTDVNIDSEQQNQKLSSKTQQQFRVCVPTHFTSGFSCGFMQTAQPSTASHPG